MVARLDDPFPEYPGKNTFLRHHAVTCLLIDGAAGMTRFADLGNFYFRFPQ